MRLECEYEDPDTGARCGSTNDVHPVFAGWITDRARSAEGGYAAVALERHLCAEHRLRELIGSLSGEDRHYLLGLLTADDQTRATQIGELHRSGFSPGIVDLLIDLEEDAEARSRVVEVLRALA